MTYIWKLFNFDAAHYLPHVPDGHKCKRLHGHSYWVRITCKGDLDERHMDGWRGSSPNTPRTRLLIWPFQYATRTSWSARLESGPCTRWQAIRGRGSVASRFSGESFGSCHLPVELLRRGAAADSGEVNGAQPHRREHQFASCFSRLRGNILGNLLVLEERAQPAPCGGPRTDLLLQRIFGVASLALQFCRLSWPRGRYCENPLRTEVPRPRRCAGKRCGPGSDRMVRHSERANQCVTPFARSRIVPTNIPS